jgi:TRAP-type transport system periplasmic protein
MLKEEIKMCNGNKDVSGGCKIGFAMLTAIFFFGILMCAAFLPVFAQAQQKVINLKYAGGLAQGTPLEIIPEWWGKELEKRSGGRVKVTFYFSEALGKQFDYPKMLKSGVADIALLTTAGADFPMLGGFMAPFVITNPGVNGEAMWSLYYKGLLKELDEYKPLFYEPTDHFYFLFKNKKVTKLEDLKGMKLRGLPGFGAALNDALGATGIAMPAQDVYTALERGTLNGLSTTPPFAQLMKLREVTKYCLFEPLFASGNIVGMTRKLWNSLPSDIQIIIEELNAEARVRYLQTVLTPAQNMENMKKLGFEVYRLTPQERARWQKAAQPIVDKWVREQETKGLPAKQVLETIKQVVELYE